MSYIPKTRLRIRRKLSSALSTRTGLRDEAGQALIELALILPIFVALLAGAAEYGSLAYQAIEVSSAARAGVAYGSQSTATAADTAGMRAAATNDGANVSGLSASAKEFWSCSNAPSVQYTSTPSCTTGNHVLSYVEVNTTATITPAIHLPGLSGSFTLTGQAIMRVL